MSGCEIYGFGKIVLIMDWGQVKFGSAYICQYTLNGFYTLEEKYLTSSTDTLCQDGWFSPLISALCSRHS